ncbi:MAG: M20 family metallopeptidase [Actinobacteria bacterium]|nr:M20 family metallopeptidase [Actinomycetota bacterium]
MHPFLATAQSMLPQVLSDIEAIVSIESPSRNASQVAKSAAQLESIIQRVAQRASVLVASSVGPHVHVPASGVPRILLLGHHDTVHPMGTLAARPFSNDGKVLRGPGVFDMAAGIVQAIYAMAILEGAGVDTSGIEMLWTSDEEIGSSTSRALIEERAQALAKNGAVLVLEPSADGGALKIARKGTGTFDVRITGRASHAGLEPEKGINALLELAHQVQRISTFGNAELGTTVTPTVASAGTTDNTVPAEAQVLVDARVVVPEEKIRVEKLMSSLVPVVSGASISVTGSLHRPPMHSSMSEELFALAVEAQHAVTGESMNGVSVGGGSDGNFTAAIGIRTLDGLGAVGGGAHGETEHVVVESIAPRIALLAELMQRILAQ